MVERKLIKNENPIREQVIGIQNQITLRSIIDERKSHETKIWISQLLEDPIWCNETRSTYS